MEYIVFIIVLSILIVVHEWGHFISAKKCGVMVEQFALGFGPKLFSKVWDGTEFCLCLIPLGGYVKMAGDDRTKVTGNSEEFLSKSIGQRSLIVVMGPIINLVLAYFCFWMVFMIGKVDLEATSKKVPAVIGKIVKNSPAEKAGFKIKDEVVSINGQAIAHWPDLQSYISQSKEASLKIVINRDGQKLVKDIVPEDQTQKDLFGREQKSRIIGVGSLQVENTKDLVIVRYGPIESLGKAAIELGDITVKTYTTLFEMLIGKRSPKEMMGIIGMFFVIKFALTIGFSFLLHFVGLISASLALFNLLPIIPLDGGHLLFFLIEKFRGRVLSQKSDELLAKIGISLMGALVVFVLYVDSERVGWIDHVVKIFRG